jgi:FtsZ-binding cell division protein ZapB
MSTIDKLKQAEALRTGKYSESSNKIQQQPLYNKAPTPESAKVSRTNTTWLIGLLFLTLVLSNLGFAFRLFFMMKGYASDTNSSLEKLSQVEKVVTDNANKINLLASEIKAMNLKSQDNQAKVTQLVKEANRQSAALENLTKTKEDLFNRVSSLESKLNK